MADSQESEKNKSKGKRHRKRGSKARKLTKKDIAIIGSFGLGLFIFIALIAYFIMALGGIIFPANRAYIPPEQGITIYVQSNGFHTDFVVPIKNEDIKLDWLQKIGDSTLLAKYSNHKYIAMGWGDEGFYMDSYNNEFPTIPTIFSALFVPTSTLMHIDFYVNDLQTDDSVVKLIISPQQYQILIKYIEQSFKKDIDNHFIPKNAKGYGKNDYFFHANNYYHLFRTCNDWTNNGLKSMGIKTASKAPFASGVMYHIK
jgi:uncharacterized protein (TIGR02117 family)